MLDFPVALTPDGDTVLVTFADVAEAITFGMDEVEAQLQAVDAPESALSSCVEVRQPVPAASLRAWTVKPGQPGFWPTGFLFSAWAAPALPLAWRRQRACVRPRPSWPRIA